MTMIGNRPEWVYAMVACFRIGAVALPSTEQLRPKDLRARFDVVEPRARDRRPAQPRDARRERLRRPGARRARTSALFDASPRPGRRPRPRDPALITFTSGTSGEPKPIRHGQRYLAGQRVQAEHWFGARPGDLVLVHGGERLVEVGPQRVHRAVDPRAPPRCSRTRASTPTSGCAPSSARA